MERLRSAVGTGRLRTRRLSSRTIHVSFAPDAADQVRWTSSAAMTIRYDVTHQLDVGDIQAGPVDALSISFSKRLLAYLLNYLFSCSDYQFNGQALVMAVKACNDGLDCC